MCRSCVFQDGGLHSVRSGVVLLPLVRSTVCRQQIPLVLRVLLPVPNSGHCKYDCCHAENPSPDEYPLSHCTSFHTELDRALNTSLLRYTFIVHRMVKYSPTTSAQLVVSISAVFPFFPIYIKYKIKIQSHKS